MEKNKIGKVFGAIRFRAFISLMFTLFIAALLVFINITYSWIFSTEFSEITGVGIALSDSQGLIMTIDGNVAESIDINDYLGEAFTDFSMQEASSANGDEIFLRDGAQYYPEPEIYDEIGVSRDDSGVLLLRDADSEDHNRSFIYFSLMLEAAGDNRYLVFDDTNSYIKDLDGFPFHPIRLSLSFIHGGQSTTKIFGTRTEFLGNFQTEAVYELDTNTSVGYTTDQEVSEFNAYTGYDGEEFSSLNTLYYLEQEEQVEVIVRIWLEGGDPETTDEIAGSLLDIAITFDNIAESEVI